MKTHYFLLCIIAFCFLSSFAPSEACSYAGSNMSYVQTQTKKALADNNLNKSRFFTYQAIKVIQTSVNKFDDCGCKDAEVSISESLINLKAATRAKSLNGSRILLNEALKHTIDALDALSQHELHDNAFSSKEFALNTSIVEEETLTEKNFEQIKLHQRIDTSLLKYKESLAIVVDSISCTDATAFANKIFEQCEQELFKNNLSEAKKYYNLRTKEITAEALLRLGDCSSMNAK